LVLAVLSAVAVAIVGSPVRADALGGASTSSALSVTLTDHRARVGPDMVVRYVAALTNHGASTVRATLRVYPPRHTMFMTHRPDATWRVQVRPSQRVRRHVMVRFGALTRHAKRVTAKASVYLHRQRRIPLIWTVDADHIDHAAVAAIGPVSRPVRSARATPHLAVARPHWGITDRLYVGIPAGVLAGLVLLLAALARRRPSPRDEARLPIAERRSGGGRLAR
jgi:hypothetical protein